MGKIMRDIQENMISDRENAEGKKKGNERGDDGMGEQVVTAHLSNQTLLSPDYMKHVPTCDLILILGNCAARYSCS